MLRMTVSTYGKVFAMSKLCGRALHDIAAAMML